MAIGTHATTVAMDDTGALSVTLHKTVIVRLDAAAPWT